MHDVVLDVEVGQTSEGGLGDLAEHVDTDRSKVAGHAVEGAGGVSRGREGWRGLDRDWLTQRPCIPCT